MDLQIATSGAAHRHGACRVVPRVVVVVVVVLLTALAGCAGDEPSVGAPSGGSVTTTAAAAPDCRRPSTCTTRQLADAAGVTLGTAVAVDEADPSARLFLNEATVELLPDKAAALVSLVDGLVARGVPIDGVGLQGHLVAGSVTPGVFRSLIAQLDELGVEVAVTELDVPLTDAADPLDRQASTYGQMFDECLADACSEVTLWGFTDRYTWIDDTFGPGRAPLPFDREYRPKPALDAMRAALVRAAERRGSTDEATP